MATELKSSLIQEKYPELSQILEALSAYYSGSPVTSRCLTCGEILEVAEIKATGTLWVKCSNGCTNFRAKRKKEDL